MKTLLAAACAFFLLACAANADSDTSVRSAYMVCAMVDQTGLASQPCEVSGWHSSVIATIDMNSGEARQLCGQIANLLHQKGIAFDKGWTLQIKSPYSSGNSIAYCAL